MTIDEIPSTTDQPEADDIAVAIQRNTTDVPPMLFDVPETFLAYPLQGDPAERQAAAMEFAREMYKNGDEEMWQAVAPTIAAAGELIASAGVEYGAMGVYDNEQGGIAICTLTVAATGSDHMDPEVAALGLREVLVRDEFNESQWLDLPCGPGVSRITFTKYPLSPELTGKAEEAELIQGQIQVYIPFPTGPYIAIMTMETANMEVWAEFSRMMAMIVQSVRFPYPVEETES